MRMGCAIHTRRPARRIMSLSAQSAPSFELCAARRPLRARYPTPISQITAELTGADVARGRAGARGYLGALTGFGLQRVARRWIDVGPHLARDRALALVGERDHVREAVGLVAGAGGDRCASDAVVGLARDGGERECAEERGGEEALGLHAARVQ